MSADPRLLQRIADDPGLPKWLAEAEKDYEKYLKEAADPTAIYRAQGACAAFKKLADALATAKDLR